MKKREYSLYQSEDAVSVRNQYVELLRQGKSSSEAVALLQNMAAAKLEDAQYTKNYWLALADVMWNYGRLTEQVKGNALGVIRSMRGELSDLRSKCPHIYARRMELLGNLEEKLLAPQPEQKKINTYQLFQNDWEVGDVFAYRLSAAAEKYAGQLVYVHVVRKQSYWPGHTVPVVRVFRTVRTSTPSMDELLQAGYLPQFWGPNAYDRRLDQQYPYTVRMFDVLYNMLLSAASIQEYQAFTRVGSLPVSALELDRVDDANESTCRLFEVETVSALSKWGDTDVYALLKGQ